METASPAKMGRIISVVAVLEVSSVRKVTSKAIIRITINGCIPDKKFNCSPNQIERPDSLNPVASANPPPKRRTICQGNFAGSFPVQDLLSFIIFEGMKNRITAIMIATVPSLTYSGLSNILPQPGIYKLPKSRSDL